MLPRTITLALLGLIALPVGVARAEAGQAPAAADDPKARQLLFQMVKAYRGIGKLQQETRYENEDSRTSSMVRSRLVLQRPNRLLLEVYQLGPTSPDPVVSRFQCDGKEFYSYQQAKGFFSREKAPKGLSDFQMLSMSFEMACITGMDPFAELFKQAKGIRMLEPGQADEVSCDVLQFDLGTAERTGDLRLFIGQQDHLMRRFVYESIPIIKPEPPAPKDAQGNEIKPEIKAEIKVLDPNAPPPPVKEPPRSVRFAYENHVVANKDIPKETFTWVKPPSAFEYQGFPGLLDPTGGKRTVTGAGALPGMVGPNGEAIKPMKIISFKDLEKQAKEQEKKRKR